VGHPNFQLAGGLELWNDPNETTQPRTFTNFHTQTEATRILLVLSKPSWLLGLQIDQAPPATLRMLSRAGARLDKLPLLIPKSRLASRLLDKFCSVRSAVDRQVRFLIGDSETRFPGTALKLAGIAPKNH
jgi:hypothetical protein